MPWLCTVEDKDPPALWVQHTDGFIARWIGKLVLQSRWKIVDVPTSDVLAFYRSLLNSCLPRSLLPSDMRVELDNLPYVYGSVKLKCNRGDRHSVSGVVTCEDERHSCIRNIISFIKLPGRRTFKTLEGL